MNNHNKSKEPMHCYACQNQTDERCSYCLLPVCPEHGGHVQPWFTSRKVMTCTPCQAKLEEIAQQEHSLSWTSRAGLLTDDVHALSGNTL